jgi:hypothetical protein
MKKVLLVITLVGLMAAPQLAAAQQWFDFNGQALLPAMVGDDLTAYLVVNNNGLIATPIPLDFANYEYTIVVSGLTMDIDNGDAGKTFSGGSIVLYEDNATAADFTNPATFTDGTAILSGDMVTFNRVMFTASNGSGVGDVDWTGGTRADEINPADLTGWSFVVGISNRSTVTEPGYDENWDGKVEPLEPVVSDEKSSVSELKGRHQE